MELLDKLKSKFSKVKSLLEKPIAVIRELEQSIEEKINEAFDKISEVKSKIELLI